MTLTDVGLRVRRRLKDDGTGRQQIDRGTDTSISITPALLDTDSTP